MNVLLISLGCDKNLVDSERMLGILYDKGYQIVEEEEKADIIVINSCCFINDAKEESIETILEMAEWKKKGNVKILVVTGCLAQRYRKEILEEIPEIDAIVGTAAYEEIVEAIEEALQGKKSEKFENINLPEYTDGKRMITTSGYYSYLKIAEGCNKHCSYCIIPKVRGRYRSIPMETLIREAKDLAERGVKELILVAQETARYGMDLYREKMLPKLLRELCKIEKLQWIRILYCYPEEITDELIQVIKEEEKICHYLDLPIQHVSDAILSRMGRKISKTEMINIITKIRKEIPDIALRTTLITGFPGETKKYHRELMKFVEEMRFERLGVFTYSKEEGTIAAFMDGHIEEKKKEDRRKELMELQQRIAFENAKEMKGQIVSVIVEGKLENEPVYIARTYKDAPDIDGYLFFECSYEIISGDFVKVEVIDAQGYDLIGRLIE